MIEVEVQNFQSIEKVSFRIDKFSVLVGRSNIGKSAVVRAIKCALTGASGTDFVRHGEACERRIKGNKKCRCQTTVRIKTAAIELVWEKGDATNQYTVTEGGETTTYTAVDRGTPEFLKPDFTPMKIGSASPDIIQVSEQFRPIFLLDQSGPATADVLSDVARLDHINTAIRLVNKDRKEAASTRKVREKDVAKLQTALEAYEGLDKAVEKTKGVENRYEALEASQASLERLDRQLATLATLTPAIKALEAATRPSMPDQEALVTRGDVFAHVFKLHQEAAAKAPAIKKLIAIEKVELPDIEPITDKSQSLAQLDGWLDQLRGFKANAQTWKTLRAAKVPNVGELATGERLKVLQSFIEQLDELQTAEDALAVALSGAEAELQSVVDEFDELGICPTCTQKIDAGHVHRAVAT